MANGGKGPGRREDDASGGGDGDGDGVNVDPRVFSAGEGKVRVIFAAFLVTVCVGGGEGGSGLEGGEI